MNDRLATSATEGRASEPSAVAAARELRIAGEALMRAAAVIASIGNRRAGPASEQSLGRESMPPQQRLSGRQLGAIRAASRRAGLSRGQLVELLEKVAGKATLSELSRSEASGVLDRLSAMTGYQP